MPFKRQKTTEKGTRSFAFCRVWVMVGVNSDFTFERIFGLNRRYCIFGWNYFRRGYLLLWAYVKNARCSQKNWKNFLQIASWLIWVLKKGLVIHHHTFLKNTFASALTVAPDGELFIPQPGIQNGFAFWTKCEDRVRVLLFCLLGSDAHRWASWYLSRPHCPHLVEFAKSRRLQIPTQLPSAFIFSPCSNFLKPAQVYQAKNIMGFGIFRNICRGYPGKVIISPSCTTWIRSQRHPAKHHHKSK